MQPIVIICDNVSMHDRQQTFTNMCNGQTWSKGGRNNAASIIEINMLQ